MRIDSTSGNGTTAGSKRSRIGTIARRACSEIGKTTVACSAVATAAMASANAVGRLSESGTITDLAANRDAPAIDARKLDATTQRYPAVPSDLTTASAARCSPSVTITVVVMPRRQPVGHEGQR